MLEAEGFCNVVCNAPRASKMVEVDRKLLQHCVYELH